MIGTLVIVSSLVLAVAGGAYLYFHQSVATVRAHTPSVVRAAKTLDIPLAHQAAIALVIGYDHRAGVESNRPSLSDTLMLVRADPSTKTISLLSFPRDLDVPIYCPRSKTDNAGLRRVEQRPHQLGVLALRPDGDGADRQAPDRACRSTT